MTSLSATNTSTDLIRWSKCEIWRSMAATAQRSTALEMCSGDSDATHWKGLKVLFPVGRLLRSHWVVRECFHTMFIWKQILHTPPTFSSSVRLIPSWWIHHIEFCRIFVSAEAKMSLTWFPFLLLLPHYRSETLVLLYHGHGHLREAASAEGQQSTWGMKLWWSNHETSSVKLPHFSTFLNFPTDSRYSGDKISTEHMRVPAFLYWPTINIYLTWTQ